MMQSSTIIRFLLIATALTPTIAAQNQKDQSAATIVTRTELVYVPVLVHGSDGKHITGLTKEAFTIQQDGTPQQVAVFEEYSHASQRLTATPAPSDYVTNFSTESPSAHQITIIVIDGLNTPVIRQTILRNAILKYLGTSLRADHPIALFTITKNGLHQVHSFTSDPQLLVNALKKLNAHVGNAETNSANDTELQSLEMQKANAAGDPEMTALLERVIQLTKEANVYDQEIAIHTTLISLQQLAGALSGVPGRKSLIWMTAGFPFILDDPKSFNNMGSRMFDEYVSTWRLLNNASIAVYPVDVSGLQVFGMTSARSYSAADSVSGRDVRTARSVPVGEDRGMQQQASLRAVAEATGGKVFLNRNDLDQAFAEADNDSSSYYLLGYYLKSGVKPGWHKLKVKVEGPKCDVRAREGFYAGGPVIPADKQSRSEFLTALTAPADYTAVHFSSRATPEPRKPGDAKYVIKVDTSIPAQSLVIDSQRGNLIDFDITILALGPGDKYVGDVSNTIRSPLQPEQLERAERSGVSYHDQLELAPGRYDVRVAVRDNQSGKTGTVRMNLSLPE